MEMFVKVIKKDNIESELARQKGNKLFIDVKNHNQDTHLEILAFYSKSAAFAENNSEELASAYGNRSALLKHLKKYKECVIDVEKALLITKSEKLIKKLLARKFECLSLVEPDNDEEINNIPLMKPSKTIPCASELVELKFDEKYGRHVVATQDIKPGTVIVVEKGFLSILRHKIYSNCSHCLKLAWNALPCDYCAVAMYCSEKCKKEAWLERHDNECCVLPFIYYLEDELNIHIDYLMSAIRILITCIKTEGLQNIMKQAQEIDCNKDLSSLDIFNDGSFQSKKFKFLYSLSCQQSNDKETFVIPKPYIDYLLEKIPIIKNIKDKKLLNEILEKLQIIGRINSYSFEYFKNIYEDLNEIKQEKHSIGDMHTVFGSFFNHSCGCNVGRAFPGELVLFTLDYITKGQQLFVSYGPCGSDDIFFRQNYLSKRYYFTCNCDLCKINYPLCKFNKKTNTVSSKIFQNFINMGTYETFLSICIENNYVKYSEKYLSDTKKMLKVLLEHKNNVNAVEFIVILKNYVHQHLCNMYDTKFDIPEVC